MKVQFKFVSKLPSITPSFGHKDFKVFIGTSSRKMWTWEVTSCASGLGGDPPQCNKMKKFKLTWTLTAVHGCVLQAWSNM